jgi:predicted solute-binding protein
MKIFFPDNIFTRLLVAVMDKEEAKEFLFEPSSILSKKLNDNPHSAGLIPVLELITNKDLFVSNSVGISFEGPLSNSFIYYEPGLKEINKIKLAGDISSMEVILSKIIFKELYDSDIEIGIQTKLDAKISGNYLIAGDENFINARFEKGISIAEEVIEIISPPFVNYVLASKDKNLLEKCSSKLLPVLDKIEYNNSIFPDNFNLKSSEFIKENFNSITYKLDEQDITRINELLQLPYYHGLIKDLIEVNFV